MFYYYGRKQKIFDKYPEPEFDLIIEPFSGSAAYSMNYYKKDVILIEKDVRIAKLWQYLIDVEPDEILSLPIIDKGISLNNEEYDYLTDNQKSLIGFFLNPGSSQPKKSPGKFCAWTEKNRLKVSEDVMKVKHWKIINSDYKDIENLEATWFVDPPYQLQGKWYKHSNKFIDYNELGDWCLDRNGQTIVCENMGADWLPFEELIKLRGQKNTNMEAIWTNEI